MIFNDRPYHKNGVIITSYRGSNSEETLYRLMAILIDSFHGGAAINLSVYDAIILEKRQHESGDIVFIVWGLFLMPMEE